MRQMTGAVVPPRTTETIGDLLAAAASAVPEAIAVVTPSGRITYGHLWSSARRHAHRLSGTADRGPVAVRQDGTVEAITRSFAVMLAGRAVVAVDVALPDERVAQIVRAAVATMFPSDEVDEVSSEAVDELADRAGARPADVAMICFTSGSTGDPKGVLLSHRTVVEKVRNVVDGQGLSRADRLGDLLPLGFSAGMNTLLAGVACGATVVCADPRETDLRSLASWLRAESVTTLHTSVVAARGLGEGVRSGTMAPLADVRQVAFYGEAATGVDVARARDIADPSPTVVNWYAATEVGVIGSAVLTPDDDVPPGRIGAGRPLPGRSVGIVDPDGHPVADGVVGEVVIAGGPVADGYLGRPSTRFVTDSDGTRGYRTGDRGCIDAAGDLHLAGRVDEAVKIRGYLVEPSEVESALYRAVGVAEAVVGATTSDGRTELIAWVGGPIAAEPDVESRIRAHLRHMLPEWMVPRFVVAVTALPRTERGKLDRAALPDPTPPEAPRRRRSSPDIVESAARLAVSLAMDVEDIDSDADLMALGADSLALAQIATTVRQRVNGDIDFAAFTMTPTIATLAASIRDHYRNGGGVREGNGVLVPIRATTHSTGMRPLFVVAGAGGPASSLMTMARRLAPGRAVYGLQALGLERIGRPDRSIAQMARRYVDLITTIEPHGPYLLAGHSMGGIVAAEMAAQLADRGERTHHLIQIDTSLSENLVADLDADEHATGDADEVEQPVEPYRPEVSVSVSKRQLITLIVKVPFAGRVIFDPVTQWIIFYRRGGRLIDKHRLRRVDAPITVLAAPGTRHRRAWWQAVTSGPVNIRPVDGGHVELLYEPHVAGVAEIIDEVLDTADR